MQLSLELEGIPPHAWAEDTAAQDPHPQLLDPRRRAAHGGQDGPLGVQGLGMDMRPALNYQGLFAGGLNLRWFTRSYSQTNNLVQQPAAVPTAEGPSTLPGAHPPTERPRLQPAGPGTVTLAAGVRRRRQRARREPGPPLLRRIRAADSRIPVHSGRRRQRRNGNWGKARPGTLASAAGPQHAASRQHQHRGNPQKQRHCSGGAGKAAGPTIQNGRNQCGPLPGGLPPDSLQFKPCWRTACLGSHGRRGRAAQSTIRPAEASGFSGLLDFCT